RIVQQKLLRQAHRAQRQAEHLADMSVFRDGDFATAAAQIEHQHVFVFDAQVREYSQMDQPSLFQSGNHFYLPADSGLYPLDERAGVFRIPQWAGADHAHLLRSKLLRSAIETSEDLDGMGHGVRSERVAAENRFAQARDFAVFVDDLQFAASKLRNLKSYGICADINCRKDGHGSS